jgi:ribosomal protein S12 methylthiotransferase
MKKIGIISLGCSKNLVDSEMILGLFKNKRDIVFVNRIGECDLIIINTCGFIESSKQEALDTIFECINTKKENAKILVAGCLTQRYKKELIESIPEVDYFMSISEYCKAGEIISSLLGGMELNDTKLNDRLKYSLTPKHYAYIKIAEGCRNNCTYCAIPLIRGSLVSKDKEIILDEVDIALKEGKEEIILIAQDTTGYGYDKDDNYYLEDLLKDILKTDVKMIRMLYLYPDEIKESLIELIANNSRIVPYFDIPLQHINNDLLRNMNRRGTKEEIISIIKSIRNKIKNAVIRTTFIVGYPGETDEQFEELCEFIKDYPFDRMGAFTYSKEENTKAYDFDNQVDEEIKELRLEKLMKIQKEISLKLNEEKINSVFDVRVEIYNPLNKLYRGRSFMSAPDNVDGYVYFTSNEKLNIGDLVKVKITDADVYDLKGVKL